MLRATKPRSKSLNARKTSKCKREVVPSPSLSKPKLITQQQDVRGITTTTTTLTTPHEESSARHAILTTSAQSTQTNSCNDAGSIKSPTTSQRRQLHTAHHHLHHHHHTNSTNLHKTLHAQQPRHFATSRPPGPVGRAPKLTPEQALAKRKHGVERRDTLAKKVFQSNPIDTTAAPLSREEQNALPTTNSTLPHDGQYDPLTTTILNTESAKQNSNYYYFEAIHLLEQHHYNNDNDPLAASHHNNIRLKIFPFGLSVAIDKHKAHNVASIKLTTDSLYYLSQLDYACRHMLNSFSKLGTKQVKGIKITLFGSQHDIENNPWECYRGIVSEHLRLRGSTLMKIPLSLAITDIDRPVTHVLNPPSKQRERLQRIIESNPEIYGHPDDDSDNDENHRNQPKGPTQGSTVDPNNNTLFTDPYAIRVHDNLDFGNIQPANVSKQVYPYLNIANVLINDTHDLKFETTKPHMYFIRAMYRSMLSPSVINKYSFPFCRTPYVMRNDENTNFAVSTIVKSPLLAAFVQVGDRLQDRFEDAENENDPDAVTLNVEDPLHREYIRWKFGHKFLETQIAEHEARKVQAAETVFRKWLPPGDPSNPTKHLQDSLDYINQQWPIEMKYFNRNQLPRHPDQPQFDELRRQLEELEMEEAMGYTKILEDGTTRDTRHSAPMVMQKKLGLQSAETAAELAEDAGHLKRLTSGLHDPNPVLAAQSPEFLQEQRDSLSVEVLNKENEGKKDTDDLDERYAAASKYFQNLPASSSISRKKKFKIVRKFESQNQTTAPTLFDVILGPEEPDPPTVDNRRDYYYDEERQKMRPKRLIDPEEPADDMAGGCFEVGVDPLAMGIYHPQIPLHKIRNLMYKQVKRLKQPLDLAPDEVYRLVSKLSHINPCTLDHPMAQNINKAQGVIQQSCAAVGLNAFNPKNSDFLSTHSLAMTMSHVLSRTLDFPQKFAKDYFEWKVFEEYQMDSVVLLRTAADIFRQAVAKHEVDLQKAVDMRQEKLRQKLTIILQRKLARHDPRYAQNDLDRVFDLDLSDSEDEKQGDEDDKGNQKDDNNEEDDDLDIVVATPSFAFLQLPHTSLTTTIDFDPNTYPEYYKDKAKRQADREKIRQEQLEQDRAVRKKQIEDGVLNGDEEDGHHAQNHNDPHKQLPLQFQRINIKKTPNQQAVGLIGHQQQDQPQEQQDQLTAPRVNPDALQLSMEQRNAKKHFSQKMLPTTMMVPYLDMLNHPTNNNQHNVYVSFELAETSIVGQDNLTTLNKKKDKMKKLFKESKLGQEERAAMEKKKKEQNKNMTGENIDDNGNENDHDDEEASEKEEEEDDPSKQIVEMVSQEDLDLVQRLIIAMNVEIDHLKMSMDMMLEDVDVALNKDKAAIARPTEVAEQVAHLQRNIRLLDKALNIIQVPNKVPLANIIARRDIFPGEELMLAYHRLDDNDPNITSVSPHLPELQQKELLTLQQRDFITQQQLAFEKEREAKHKEKDLEQRIDNLMLKYEVEITGKQHQVDKLTGQVSRINNRLNELQQRCEQMLAPVQEWYLEKCQKQQQKPLNLLDIKVDQAKTILFEYALEKEEDSGSGLLSKDRAQDFTDESSQVLRDLANTRREKIVALQEVDKMTEDITVLFDKVETAKKKLESEFNYEEKLAALNNENYRWKQMSPQQLLMNYGIILPHLQQTPMQLQLKDDRAVGKIRAEEEKLKKLELERAMQNVVRDAEQALANNGELDQLLSPRRGVLKSQAEGFKFDHTNDVLFETPKLQRQQQTDSPEAKPTAGTLLSKIRQRQEHKNKLAEAEAEANAQHQQRLSTILKDGSLSSGMLSESEMSFKRLQEEVSGQKKQQQVEDEIREKYLAQFEAKQQEKQQQQEKDGENKNKKTNKHNINENGAKIEYTTMNNNINKDVEPFNLVLDMNEVALRHYQRKTFITDFVPDVSSRDKLEIIYINQQLKQQETYLLEKNELMSILRRRILKLQQQRKTNETFVFGNNPIDSLGATQENISSEDKKNRVYDPIKLAEKERDLLSKRLSLEKVIAKTKQKIEKLKRQSEKFLECTTLLELLHGNCTQALPTLFMSLEPVDPTTNRYGYSVCFDQNFEYGPELEHAAYLQDHPEALGQGVAMKKPTILHMANTNMDKVLTFILDELYNDKYNITHAVKKDRNMARLQALQQKMEQEKAAAAEATTTTQAIPRKGKILRNTTAHESLGLKDATILSNDDVDLGDDDDWSVDDDDGQDDNIHRNNQHNHEDLSFIDNDETLTAKDKKFLRRIKSSIFYHDILNLTDNYQAQCTLLAPRLLYEIISTTWIDQNVIKDISKEWPTLRKGYQEQFDYHINNDIDLAAYYTTTDFNTPDKAEKDARFERVEKQISTIAFKHNEYQKIKVLKQHILQTIPHPKQLLVKCYENIWLDNSKESMNKKRLERKVFGEDGRGNKRTSTGTKESAGAAGDDDEPEQFYDVGDDVMEDSEETEYTESSEGDEVDEEYAAKHQDINDESFDATRYIKEINTLYHNQNYKVQKHITDDDFKKYVHLSSAVETLGNYRKQQIDSALYTYAHYYDKLQRL